MTVVVVAGLGFPCCPLPKAADVPDHTVDAMEYVRLGMNDIKYM